MTYFQYPYRVLIDKEGNRVDIDEKTSFIKELFIALISHVSGEGYWITIYKGTVNIESGIYQNIYDGRKKYISGKNLLGVKRSSDKALPIAINKANQELVNFFSDKEYIERIWNDV